MHPPRAKNVIMLFMEGGPSHIDTFDPKPKLDELHLKDFVRASKRVSGMTNGTRFYVKSPFEFVKAGNAGIPMNSLFKHIPGPLVAQTARSPAKLAPRATPMAAISSSA